MASPIHPKHQAARNALASKIVDMLDKNFGDITGTAMARIIANNDRVWADTWPLCTKRKPGPETRAIVVDLVGRLGSVTPAERGPIDTENVGF